ncbi:putative F-box protein PP2-B12 [Musa acuminata AAA Group]|uniref:putative F-box protein PP2-B12 n=1 Tax=Musa acuminata AAA Group TaxID=214697 RepID=UPI0031D9FB9D
MQRGMPDSSRSTDLSRMADSGIERLPEGCIAQAISLTAPRDACRSSGVSSAFRSAAASDTVWERFLPSDCHSILSRAVHPVEYSSKRDLFFLLCDSVLIDGGKMSFWLERSSGVKCYMLSASALSIIWGDTPQYWKWVSLPDSRFSEVAQLLAVCWLEIRGRIQSKMLSPRTTYAAYLIFKLADSSRGLGHPPHETSVTVGAQSSTRAIRLQPRGTDRHALRMVNFPGGAPEAEEEELGGRAREDGWMEAEMGEFYNEDGEDEEVVMSWMEVKGGHWKKGLIVEGIEIRPKTLAI